MNIIGTSHNLPQDALETEHDSPEVEQVDGHDKDHESSQFEGEDDDSEADSSLGDHPNPDRYSVERLATKSP